MKGISGSPTVLLADSDSGRLGHWTERLQHAGYSVVGCQSADEAVAVGADEADIVVAASRLGETDGAALARRLKDEARDGSFSPVILIGADDAEARVRGFEAGCDDFIPEDVSLFELDARIRSLLGHRISYQQLAAANRQLVEAQEKKRALAALVVHDLRSPLTALQGSVDILYDELAADINVAGILGDAKDLCRKALSMVASILDVEELETGILTVCPSRILLGDLLRRLATHYRVPLQTRRLEVQVDVDEALEAELDVELVSRTVENLLNNAVRYAPIGGRVVIAATVEDGGIAIRVGNNGPPVPSEELGSIFERYYRIDARRAGARANRGLGLYFCRLVAEVHGGTILVESLPGLAACFTVHIPQPVPT